MPGTQGHDGVGLPTDACSHARRATTVLDCPQMWDASWLMISDPKLTYWMSIGLRTTVAYCLYALFAPIWMALLLSMKPRR